MITKQHESLREMPSDTAGNTTKVECTHCGLPVPAGLIEPEQKVQFCCNGCSGAYELILASGLDTFYRMADASIESRIRPSSEPQSGFQEFDEVVFQEKYATAINDDESKIELAVDGIHCGACIWLLEKLPTIKAGVVSATANWTRRTIKIRWRVNEVPLSEIARTLNKIGYPPSPIQPNPGQTRWQNENRNHLVRIGLAATCAGNNMIISAALYFGMFSHMTTGMSGLLRGASCVVGIVALLWPGRVFLKSALSAIRTRTPHMDLPIALGLSVGTIAGLANVIRGVGEIYFDSLSVLIFLLLIGRWIQFRQQAKATNAVEMLYRLTPQMTRKLVDGVATETLVDLVEVDDLLQILPGDLFPVDGDIVDGETRVDESILTGESQTLLRRQGDQVSAGTRNETSSVTVRALAVGRETRLSRIVELVEQASLDKPELVQWANRVGGYFVSIVIAIAIFTLVYWLQFDFEVAIDRTIALLIVACPCALALATPLAIAVSLGRAAKNRIMIKGGDVLQSLQKPGMIWLDKTGTITEGNLKVVRWHGNLEYLPLVAALEKTSSHPVAKAITEFACDQSRSTSKWFDPPASFNEPTLIAHQTTTVQGQGIEGTVGLHHVLLGNQRYLDSQNVNIHPMQRRLAKRQLEAGLSPCWVVVDSQVVGLIALGDAIRTDAKTSIDKMKARGWDVGILSGDHQQVVDRVAKRLDIQPDLAKGGIDPETKLQTIQDCSALGTVAMVGDGVNDSAALAAADIGIAVKGGAEASLSAAPVYFANPGLEPILDLMQLADSTARTMKVNLGVSLAYNISFAAMAFAGLINPLVAAILMPISSITVVALSLGSGRTKKRHLMEYRGDQ